MCIICGWRWPASAASDPRGSCPNVAGVMRAGGNTMIVGVTVATGIEGAVLSEVAVEVGVVVKSIACNFSNHYIMCLMCTG